MSLDAGDPLLEGYRRFRASVWPAQAKRYASLARRQQPATVVIACSDARIDPQTTSVFWPFSSRSFSR